MTDENDDRLAAGKKVYGEGYGQLQMVADKVRNLLTSVKTYIQLTLDEVSEGNRKFGEQALEDIRNLEKLLNGTNPNPQNRNSDQNPNS